MQKIIDFIIKNKTLILFLILFSIGMGLTIQTHSYHKSKFINSSSTITGKIFNFRSQISEYFNLRKENKILTEELRIFKQNEFKDGGSFKHLLFKNNLKPVKRKTDGLIFHVPYKNGIALNRPHSAIIKNGFKLITFHDNNERALFKINSDISESNNLVNSHKKETKKLSEILDHYLIQVKAPKWQPGITWKNKSLKNINSFH